MTTLRLHLLMTFCLLSLASLVNATPTQEQLMQLNSSVLRVQVEFANGGFGLGSGVVIAKDQIATSCHVIMNAEQVNVISRGSTYKVNTIRSDWKHDVCILKTQGLDVPAVRVSASKNLRYEQPVFTVGYPGLTIRPVNTYGAIKGLYPMDDGVVIRASSAIMLGASGGGLFDESGSLVGLITVKSPGSIAYYYNVSTEWIQAARKLPEHSLYENSELPFWAQAPEIWPYFMKVVQPYLTGDWTALQKVAKEWAEKEPNTSDAWFYLATAEYATKNTQLAALHLRKVLAMNKLHDEANHYLQLITQENDQANAKAILASRSGKPANRAIRLVVAKE